MSKIALLAERISAPMLEFGDTDILQSTRREMKWQMKEYLEENDYLPVSEDFLWEMKAEGYDGDRHISVEWKPGERLPEWALYVQITLQCEVVPDV